MSRYLPTNVSDQADAYARDKWNDLLGAIDYDLDDFTVSDLATALFHKIELIRIELGEEEADSAVISMLLALIHGLKQEVIRKAEGEDERRSIQ